MSHTYDFGPWKVDENEGLPLAVIEDTEDGDGVCELWPPTRTPENIAKADLISAAPELLSRLDGLLEQAEAMYARLVLIEGAPDTAATWGDAQDEIDNASAAIDKVGADHG